MDQLDVAAAWPGGSRKVSMSTHGAGILRTQSGITVNACPSREPEHVLTSRADRSRSLHDGIDC